MPNHSQDLFLPTPELLVFLKDHRRIDKIFPIECNITKPPFNCTHQISYVSDDTILDYGIDDEEVEWSNPAFLEAYPNTVWRIPKDIVETLAKDEIKYCPICGTPFESEKLEYSLKSKTYRCVCCNATFHYKREKPF